MEDTKVFRGPILGLVATLGLVIFVLAWKYGMYARTIGDTWYWFFSSASFWIPASFLSLAYLGVTLELDSCRRQVTEAENKNRLLYHALRVNTLIANTYINEGSAKICLRLFEYEKAKHVDLIEVLEFLGNDVRIHQYKLWIFVQAVSLGKLFRNVHKEAENHRDVEQAETEQRQLMEFLSLKTWQYILRDKGLCPPASHPDREEPRSLMSRLMKCMNLEQVIIYLSLFHQTRDFSGRDSISVLTSK